MNTHIIDNINDFGVIYDKLKDSAKINTIDKTLFVIGFDIEYISQANLPHSFSQVNELTGQTGKHSAVCLVQIATSDICIVINLLKLGKQLPSKLIDIITKPSWMKLGVNIDGDLRLLSECYNLGQCGGSIELQNFGLYADIETPSLEFMYNCMFSSNIIKKGGVFDWSKDLQEEQLLYASKDAIMSYRLGITILKPSIDLIKQNKTIHDKNDIVINLIQPITPNNTTKIMINHVGKLNEYCQKNKKQFPDYTFTTLDKSFQMTCRLEKLECHGIATNKQDAKNKAAENMLILLDSFCINM